MVLRRIVYHPDGIIGTLTQDDGEILATTLEHSYDGWPKVPAGSYTCVRRRSPHFGYDVFVLTNVPDHTFIELHRANWQTDLNGCIGLGKSWCESPEGTMITQSQATFDAFMKGLTGVDSFLLTIEDGIRA